MTASTPTQDLPRDDIQAALEARRELGPEMEPAVVDAFVERMERAIEARVDARLAQQRAVKPSSSAGRGSELILAIVSLGVAIPLTAASAATAGLLAVLVVWLGLVGFNWAYWQRRG